MITSEQKKAIESNATLILVKAGAGTGKTEVLSRRILRLLDDDQNLSIKDMVIITFTNKATENLLSRLKLYLYHQWKSTTNTQKRQRYRYELENLNSCQISTIHKFCKAILDVAGPIHFPDFEYSPNFKVSEAAMIQAVERTFESWLTQKKRDQKEVFHEKYMPFHQLRKTVIDSYTMIRSQGLSLEKVLKTTKDSLTIETGNPRHIKQEIVEILEQLHRNHQRFRLQSLDPDNLLEYCFKLLSREPDIVKSIKSNYKYLFVDEFQDTSMYQTGIIRKLCDGTPESPNLFVVGDSKQSIYQFRGADLSAYESVEKWIVNYGEVLTLSTNFRSTGELVILVNSLFKRIKESYPEIQFKPEPLRSNQISKEPVTLTDAYQWTYAKKDESQPKLVAEYIRSEIDRGASPNEFAILFRKNYPMIEFADELAKLNIPFQLIGAGNFFNQREIIDTYKLVNFILFPDSKINIEEALETIYFSNDRSRVYDFVVKIQSQVAERTPAQLLESIYQITSIRERLITSKPQAVANLNKLKELARNFNIKETIQLHEFQDWLHAMIASHKEEQQSDIPTGEDANSVTLITIHKAKGLEYPIVILPSLEETLSKSVLQPAVVYNKATGLEYCYTPYYGEKSVRVPSPNYETTVESYKQDLYSEELRVLYVALTRAEKKLVFVGSEHCPKSAICFQNWLKLI
ncbi:UvrD-helicase domain-containing protein [Paenibacillus sp. sptzw28]|uniref:UvrD-helicase domain-containing protein n=1 Tax=Paenibacillus sp. sptzw28 TaxID=715179 RepID=UPI001C6F5107|nr:UvrD-helicase domain-containing protein [Paenibacillus sp. sptzw28]QYR20990.1 UvrD-helicase domain-containing protein [Paenibacillus sp. sptzw28]